MKFQHESIFHDLIHLCYDLTIELYSILLLLLFLSTMHPIRQVA